jgi:hypothetical protein
MITDEEVHDFDKDNKESRRLEMLVVADIQKKKYASAHKYEPDNSDGDIFIDEINEGIEVKNDIMAAKTHNICIEIGQTLKDSEGETVPSGLLKTKFKFWMQFDQIKWNFAYTARIKKMYYWYLDAKKKYVETLSSSTLTGEELTKLERDLREKLMGMQIKYRVRENQKNGVVKLMDLFLVPQKIFQKICLEVETLENMTYKDLI